MTAQEETAKKEGQAVPPICPFRFMAYIISHDPIGPEVARCITDKCAWFEICINLTRLGREHHEY